MKHIAIARLWFEGNSFCPRLTTLADFHQREWHDAQSAPDAYRGSRTEMGAAFDWAEANSKKFHTHIVRCAAAPPGGPLAVGVYATIVNEIIGQIATLHQQHGLDGVYLSLHGAMVAQDSANADYMLVTRLRKVLGDTVPVALSFDLHANLNPALADLAQIIVGYKTYPHIDMFETAEKALKLLAATVVGDIRPVSAISCAGLILPSHNMTTWHGPMADIEALAAGMVQSGDLLDATPFGGFAYADTRYTSASASVCVDILAVSDAGTGVGAGSAVHARAQLHARSMSARLAGAFNVRAAQFFPILPDPSAGLALAVSVLNASPTANPDVCPDVPISAGCVAVLDPADNPLSGGTGDTTGLFHALLQVTLAWPTVFAFFSDPDLVSSAASLGVGATINTMLGARVTAGYGQPVPFEATIERLTDGIFSNDGPMERGLVCHIGRSVVLRSVAQPNLRVIITSGCQSPNDMAWCRLHGIDLAEVRLFCVKAKNHFRAAFAAHLLKIIDIDAPGPAMLHFSALPYQHIRREYLRDADLTTRQPSLLNTLTTEGQQ